MSEEDKPNGRPPIAANLDQSMYRISMGLAKHSQLLSTLNKSRTTATTATTTTLKRGFSSTTKTTTPLPKPPIHTSHTSSTNPLHDIDINPAYALAPNTGIGFSTPSSAPLPGPGGARAREDAVLKTRLLGRNAAAQKAAGAENRKRAAAGGGGGSGSDSEEELGRSAVGRARGKRARVAVVANEVKGGGVEEGQRGGFDAKQLGSAEVEVAARGGEAEPEMREAESAEGAAERRKRKKRNNKKKKASSEGGIALV
ncbi:hypothetical protein B0T25DRAFT_556922 [Lasiosphaeria hispida]|uniref:Uncharacterized protein n=1 Tax=Lasiosphaeria hispida TaxID=260671 RepID=A0AAJ0M9V6_9PEZI|nr:hypothetical protein B0T25DRAFT_556922 [Lasiosphaeria hispida]